MAGGSDASQFADVDWERSLQGRLEDVVHYGLAILPYEELSCLAMEKAIPQAWVMCELQRYLNGSLRRDLNTRYADGVSQGSRDLYVGYADGFSTQFCLALEQCCSNIQQQGHCDEANRRQEVLWVYAPRQMELPCIRRLPRNITDPINIVLEILREYLIPRRRDASEENMFEENKGPWATDQVDLRQPQQTRESVANAGHTFSLDALAEAWRKEGYHEHLLRRYVWYRMIKQAPSRQHGVNLVVGQLFDKPWEKRLWDPTADRNDESDLRIHYLK
jgi:hypothetical protein